MLKLSPVIPNVKRTACSKDSAGPASSGRTDLAVPRDESGAIRRPGLFIFAK
jgi:hypothetical protein